MGFKKIDGSTWQPITPKKLKGTPYTGTLPAVLTGTKAGYLHKYKIYGSTEQAGTPTPENPIIPSECGERTENLFDKNATDTTNGYVNNRYITIENEPAINSGYIVSEYIDISRNAIIYISSVNTDSKYASVCFYDEIFKFISGEEYNKRTSLSVSVPLNAVYCRISCRKTLLESCMLTEGSTAPASYIPYGYKLPLTSAGQDVDIYLGESQTTRRIKKLVLDGTENWERSTRYIGSCYVYLYGIAPNAQPYSPIICTHVGNKSSPYQYGNGVIDKNSLSLWLFDEEVTPTRFKSFLATQYANGTPVTVWYVLNEPETGIVNEPLMKIGDYADTIDSTQTSAQIPTSAGSTTISWAGEGLAPSEFDSIQEWVDIPTYTRINGEWVAE